jgi:hypothetical protein
MCEFKNGLLWHPKKLKCYMRKLLCLWKKRNQPFAFVPGELRTLVIFIVTKLLNSGLFEVNEIDFVFDVIVIEYFLRRVEEPDEDSLDWDTSYDNWDGFRCGLAALKQRDVVSVSRPTYCVWQCWHDCAYSIAH